MAAPSSIDPNEIILQSGNGQNLVSWPIIQGATSYLVQRSTDGVNWTLVSTITGSPLATSYIDTSVLVGVEYFYQVAASNTDGASIYVASYPPSITPCLPGQINLGYLRYFAQLRCDQLNGEFLTKDEWNFGINQDAFELYDLCVSSYGDDYFFAPPLLVNLTGAQSYPIPNGSNYLGGLVNGAWSSDGGSTPAQALYKLNGIDGNISGGAPGPNAGWVPLSRMNWSDRDRFTSWPGQAGALNNIYQMSYRQMGSNLFLFPQNQNFLVQIWYVPILSQMLSDTDMLPFSISGWSEYVIVSAALRAAIKEESFELASALSTQKEGLRQRITEMAANRDVGQVNSVSNTRATMGDPGLSDSGSGFWGGGFGGSGGGW